MTGRAHDASSDGCDQPARSSGNQACARLEAERAYLAAESDLEAWDKAYRIICDYTPSPPRHDFPWGFDIECWLPPAKSRKCGQWPTAATVRRVKDHFHAPLIRARHFPWPAGSPAAAGS